MTHRMLALIFTLLLGACSSPSTELCLSEGVHLDFEGKAGLGGWTVVSGDWQVASAGTGQALAQLGASSSRKFNVALLDERSFLDLDLSVSFLAVEGEIDQGGGPLWRARDERNYYVARYNPLEDNYRVYTVQDGHRRQLLGAEINATPGWHTLRVTMAGDQIRCFYDGELSLELRDSTFTEAGQVGLWTKADARTRFDDLRIQPAHPTCEGERAVNSAPAGLHAGRSAL